MSLLPRLSPSLLRIRRLRGATPGLVAAAVLLLLASPVLGQGDSGAPLVVGTKITPPFVERGPDGSWQGLSVDLWRALADSLGLEWRFEERDLPGLLTGVREGSLDLGVAAVTVTPVREREFDFTHPFHTTGLAIATPRGGGMSWVSVIRQVFSREFLTVVVSLGLLLLGFGFLVWALERRRNPEQFGGSPAHGIGAGFWWAAVTMTTVGYGDKAPVTPGGRFLAIVWMFAAIIVISGFTAAIASALTASQLEGRIAGPEDLGKVRVGTVAATASAAWLDGEGLGYRGYPDLEPALEDLAEGRLDAVVYDAPILKYTCRTRYPDRLTVLPGIFTRQDYAILLPQGSDLAEPLNRALLEVIQSPWWQDRVRSTLGR